MNIEDCEVGMEIKDGEDNEYIIREVGSNKIKLKGFICSYPSKFFEPVNKFEVGDEVIFTNILGEKYKAKIWGIPDRADSIDGVKYGISVDCDEENRVFLVKEDRLSPLKKKDELEVGDKFKTSSGTVYEILSVGYDDFYNDVDYYIKAIKGNRVGRTGTILSKRIDEIIYG